MYCDANRSILHFYQQMVFFLGAFGSYLVVLLTDKMGRLFGFYVMGVIYIVAPIIAYMSNNIAMVSIAIGLIYVAVDINNQLNIIYFNEVVGNKMRSKVSIFWIFQTLGGLVINFILMYIFDFKVFLLLSIFPNLLIFGFLSKF